MENDENSIHETYVAKHDDMPDEQRFTLGIDKSLSSGLLCEFIVARHQTLNYASQLVA